MAVKQLLTPTELEGFNTWIQTTDLFPNEVGYFEYYIKNILHRSIEDITIDIQGMFWDGTCWYAYDGGMIVDRDICKKNLVERYNLQNKLILIEGGRYEVRDFSTS